MHSDTPPVRGAILALPSILRKYGLKPGVQSDSCCARPDNVQKTEKNVRGWDSENGDLVAIVVPHDSDSWLAITQEGFFAQAANLITVLRGVEAYQNSRPAR